MPTVVEELVTILGIDIKGGTKTVLDKFNLGLDRVTQFATWAGAALTATSVSIAYLVERTTQAAGELEKFTLLTGIGTDTLQGWMYAAERAGGSADSLQNDLMSLTKTMSSPIPGEFNHALFMLGINLHKSNGELKSADEVLLNVADKFQNMSKVRQIQWASRIGISDDTLLLLQQGRSAIDEYIQQARSIPTIVDEKNLKMAREFTIQMKTLHRVSTYLLQMATSAAGPILKEIVKDVQTLLSANKEFIQMGLRNFIEGIIIGFRRIWEMIIFLRDGFYSMLPSWKGFTETLLSIETISQVVYTILLSLGAVLAYLAAGWIATAAGIALAITAIEDIIVYFQGGESAIGSLIEKIKELYKEFSEKFPNLTALAKRFWDSLVLIGKIAWGDLVTVLNTLWETLKGIAFVAEKALGFILQIAEKGASAFLKMDDFLAGGWTDLFKNAFTRPNQNPINSTNQQGPTVHITQHISGVNAPAVAEEVSARTNNALRDVYPGNEFLVFQ